MPSKGLRIALAVLTCYCWFNYFSFLHNTVRTCRLCVEITQGAKNTLMKVLFILVMCCFGYSFIHCFFCIMGCIHVWKTPCQTFQSENDIMKAYHAIVWEDQCEAEVMVKGALKKVF